MRVETERLIIRPYQKEDYSEVIALLKNPLVMKFSLKGPIEKEEAKKYIQEFFIEPLKRGKGLWPIVLKESDVIIGFAGLLEQAIGKKEEIELGYRLSPEYWGKGYAKESSLAICEFSRKVLIIKHLITIIDPENLPSMHLAKSLGFKFYQKYVHKGCYLDIYIKEL